MKTYAKLLLLLVGIIPLLTTGCLVVEGGRYHHREAIVAPVPVLVPVPVPR